MLSVKEAVMLYLSIAVVLGFVNVFNWLIFCLVGNEKTKNLIKVGMYAIEKKIGKTGAWVYLVGSIGVKILGTSVLWPMYLKQYFSYIK